MKLSKQLLAGTAALALGAGAFVPAANAEITADVGVASSYLWRGYDLGSGTPAVFGDVGVSASGFYAGIWGSSGDTGAGTEYDLYGGYNGSVGDFSYGLNVTSYVYPSGPGYTDGGTDVGDLMEGILTLGYGPVTLNYYDNLEGADGYTYTTLAATFGKFTGLLGAHKGDTNEAVHLNLTYAYNDNLSFTVSKIISSNDGDIVGGEMVVVDDDPLFVVTYAIPLQ